MVGVFVALFLLAACGRPEREPGALLLTPGSEMRAVGADGRAFGKIWELVLRWDDLNGWCTTLKPAGVGSCVHPDGASEELVLIGDYEHGRHDGFVFGQVMSEARTLRLTLADGRTIESSSIVRAPGKFRLPYSLFVIPVENFTFSGDLVALGSDGKPLARVGLSPA